MATVSTRVKIPVLVVEKEPFLAQLLTVALRRGGYDVHRAGDGEGALHQARMLRPHVVVVDLMLGEMDGLDVCRALRSDVATSAASIVALTGEAGPGQPAAALAAGADDYVAKPFSGSELVSRVQAASCHRAELRGLSPVTGLRGPLELRHQVDAALAGPRPDYALLHVGVEHLAAYADGYGAARAEHAIAAVASALREVLEGVERAPRILAHLDSEAFGLLVPAAGGELVAGAVVDAVEALAPSLYDPLERARGTIEVRSRSGLATAHPFLAVSVGVTTSAAGHRDAASALRAARKLRAVAAVSGRSAYRMDRRGAARSGARHAELHA